MFSYFINIMPHKNVKIVLAINSNIMHCYLCQPFELLVSMQNIKPFYYLTFRLYKTPLYEMGRAGRGVEIYQVGILIVL